jgi:hypothetical protein
MTRTDSSRPSRGQAETTLPTPVPCLYRPGDPRIPHARAADFQSAFGRFRFCVHRTRKVCHFQAVNDDSRRFGMAGLVGKNRAKSPGKLFIAKRLRERGVFSETRWKLARPIAGRENNRHAGSPRTRVRCFGYRPSGDTRRGHS